VEGLIEVAKSILINNLNVNSSEQVLNVTDTKLIDIVEFFYVAGLELGNETVIGVDRPNIY
jgi:hypothetical protein